MLKISTDTFRIFLRTVQMPSSRFDQFPRRACRRLRRDGLLDVGVGHFIRIEFLAVTRKIERFDLVGVLRESFLYRLAMMSPRVVENQEDLLLRGFDETAHEIGQDVAVDRTFKNISAHLPFVGHGGNNRQAIALAVDADNRCFAFRCEAAAAHIVAAQSGSVRLNPT